MARGALAADWAGLGGWGKYSAPVWPQTTSVGIQAPRKSALNRICFAINMLKMVSND